ncbi:MAG TPA: protein-L-isoaspartate O-methyltransferase [Xanthobacteraceae bacterium]|nr:protein-L-isoaspartate O-methyltransferase [Xanthobacteraceae bacterium]
MSSFAAARQKMVDGQIRPADVTDIRIIGAMLATPREAFLPEPLRAMAYLDLNVELPVTKPGAAPRYLISPVVIARLLQAASVTATDNVLVVGCATGYTAAIAAKLAGSVVATESDAALVAQAREALAAVGCGHVQVEQAEPADGFIGAAQYDVIIFDGATEVVPTKLYDQLGEGGRLAGVFATQSPARAMLVTRSQDDFGSRVLFDISTPVLPGMNRAAQFVF